jgi:hypothetical protein
LNDLVENRVSTKSLLFLSPFSPLSLFLNLYFYEKISNYPGPELVLLVLLVSGDEVIWISAIPPELVLLRTRNVYVLEENPKNILFFVL